MQVPVKSLLSQDLFHSSGVYQAQREHHSEYIKL